MVYLVGMHKHLKCLLTSSLRGGGGGGNPFDKYGGIDVWSKLYKEDLDRHSRLNLASSNQA